MGIAMKKLRPDDGIIVDAIYTLRYFEHPADRFFEGETHDFWELMYIDKGKAVVHSGETRYLLEQGSLIFHKPMQFHDMRALGEDAPNMIVASFSSRSPAMALFENKCFLPSRKEKELLVAVIREAQQIFYYGENDPYLTKLIRRMDVPFGASQIVRMSLERFLIEVIRCDENGRSEENAGEMCLRDTKACLEADAIIEFLNQNITKRLTLDDICREFFLSKSYLQVIFKKHTGISIMDYYSKLRIRKATELIRGGRMNFTEIADHLNYASIYHFSRKFKENTGMTPTEYAASQRR